MKKKIVRGIFVVLIFIVIAQSLPVMMLKPYGAKHMNGANINLYYQPGDEKGAQEVFDYLEKTAGEIREKLEFDSLEITQVYLYKEQTSLWMRKYGLITILAAPDWYVGDNKGDQVLLVSPYAKVKGNDNDHDSILEAATHELVHTINYQINPQLSYWLDNGVATFLSHQNPPKGFVSDIPIPSLEDMRSENEKRFGEIGGYQYSYTYIDFINSQYGWECVLDLINGKKNYEEIFDKSEQDIYTEWMTYISKKF